MKLIPEKDADPRSLKLDICFTMPNFYGPGLFSFSTCYYCLILFLCCIKQCIKHIWPSGKLLTEICEWCNEVGNVLKFLPVATLNMSLAHRHCWHCKKCFSTTQPLFYNCIFFQWKCFQLLGRNLSSFSWKCATAI